MFRKAVALLLVALVLASCSDSKGPGDEVTGVVVDIESAGLGQVEGFTLKAGDDTFEILIDPDVDYGFNLDHLHEHRASADPVKVELDDRSGDLYALSIEDA